MNTVAVPAAGYTFSIPSTISTAGLGEFTASLRAPPTQQGNFTVPVGEGAVRTLRKGTFLTLPLREAQTVRTALAHFRCYQIAHAVAPENTIPVVGVDLRSFGLLTNLFPELGKERPVCRDVFAEVERKDLTNRAAERLDKLGIKVGRDSSRVGWRYDAQQAVFGDVLDVDTTRLKAVAETLNTTAKEFLLSRLEAYEFEQRFQASELAAALVLLQTEAWGGSKLKDLLNLWDRGHLEAVYKDELMHWIILDC